MQIKNLLISEFSNILRFYESQNQRVRSLLSDTTFNNRIEKAGVNLIEYENGYFGQALMLFPYSFNKNLLFSYDSQDYYQSFKNDYNLSQNIIAVLENLKILFSKVNDYNMSLNNNSNKLTDLGSRTLFYEIRKLGFQISMILPRVKEYK